MDDITKDVLKSVGVTLACAAVFMAVASYLAHWGNEVNCRDTAAAMGVPYHYSLTTPCMIKPDGKPWVPLHSYRVI